MNGCFLGSQNLLLTISVGQKMLKNRVHIDSWLVKIRIMGHIKVYSYVTSPNKHFRSNHNFLEGIIIKIHLETSGEEHLMY